MPRKKRSTGYFITLEGGEGTGKSTQLKLLEARLKDAGYPVIATREPGGTDQAEEVREIILSGSAELMGAEFEAMLFTSARLDHVEKLIAPALEEGHVVISDRFADSTRVYQGATGEVDKDMIAGLEELVRELAWPDLTIILDLDPKTGLGRAADRDAGATQPDRFEREDIFVHKKRRKAFLKLADEEPRRCKVVDADGDPHEVHEKIWKLVSPRVKRRIG